MTTTIDLLVSALRGSVRAIAKACGASVAEVNRVIDRWAETAVNPEVRKHTLALELARLDQFTAGISPARK
jgi:hypothetical protein